MGVRRVSLIQQTFTKSARASANRILYIRVRMTQCRVQVTYLQPPLKDFVGLCWSASSNPSPRNVLESYPPSQRRYQPANNAAARAGPLSASISDSLVWTSASLDDNSSRASSNRFSSPSASNSASFASMVVCSFSR